jgi:hypothetical protein
VGNGPLLEEACKTYLMERTVRKERELSTSDVSTPYASVPAPPFEAHFSVHSVVIFLRTMNNPGYRARQSLGREEVNMS